MITCPVCDRDFQAIASGKIKVHGPRNNRCPGSGQDPAGTVTDEQMDAVEGVTSPPSELQATPSLGVDQANGTVVDFASWTPKDPELAAKKAEQAAQIRAARGLDDWDPSDEEVGPVPKVRGMNCPRCDRDAHRCRGCGAPVKHTDGTDVCDDCETGLEQNGLTVEDLAPTSVAPSEPTSKPEPVPVGPRPPAAPCFTGRQRLETLDADIVLGRREVAEQAIQFLRDQPGGTRLAVDIETEGIGLLARHIKCVIVSDGTTAAIFDPRDEVQRKLVKWLIGHAKELVFHNCFAGDTRALTRTGARPLRELVGQPVELWTGDAWVESTVHRYGPASVTELELGMTRSRCEIRRAYRSTENHRWVLRDGSIRTTADLRPGDVLQAAIPKFEVNEHSEAFLHGLVFADGALNHTSADGTAFSHQIRLCGDKARYASLFPKVTHPASYAGDPMAYIKASTNYKELPATDDPVYLASFIAGWVALDGDHKERVGVTSSSWTLSTAREDHARWIEDHASAAGWMVTGSNSRESATDYGICTLHRIQLTQDTSGRSWTVKAIRRHIAIEDEVFCPWVPGVERFTLDGNVLTMNSPFDVPNLALNDMFTTEDCAKVIDTLLYARLAEPDSMVPKNLGACANRYLGLAYDDGGMMDSAKAVGIRSKKDMFRNFDLDRPVYVRGAATDAIVTHRLVHAVRKAALTRLMVGHPFADWGVSGQEALRLLEREQRLNRMSLRRVAVKGLRADLEYNDRFIAQFGAQMYTQAREITEAGIRPGVSADLVKWLEERDQIPAGYPRTGKTKALSGQKAHLELLAHPLAKLFVEHKEQTKILHDYLEKVADLAVADAHGDMRIFPVVNYFGAVTGRASMGDPPLHQFPEGARGVILADEGDSLTSIDWSQIEPVVIANIAGQTDVLEGYESGREDFYDTLARVTGLPRKKNKTQLLGTLYGQGKKLTAAKLGVSLEEAEEVKAAVFAPMPQVLELTKTLRQIAEEYQMVPTISGRIVPVSSGWYEDPETGDRRWSVHTHKGVNYHVQGSAYDVLAESLLACEEAGYGDAIYLHMHDEVVCSTEAAPDIRKIMSTPPERLIRHAGRVPVLRTDLKDLGKRWDVA